MNALHPAGPMRSVANPARSAPAHAGGHEAALDGVATHESRRRHQLPARQSGFFDDFALVNPAWPLQEAKNKLSELIDRAAAEGAQAITRHGRPVAVVVSAETYSRLQPAETLADILLDCPVKDWEVERDQEAARDLEFD